jgi:excisionase family DNA binding protein
LFLNHLRGKSPRRNPLILATDEGIREAPQGNNMTVGELADFLQLHPSMQLHSSAIYRLLRQGKLRAFKVGSNWCFSREAIRRLVRQEIRQ